MSMPSQAEVAVAAAMDAELRKRAARQAAGELSRETPPELTRVRVLKLGADRISMGVHIAGVGEAFYERGESFDTEVPIARELEDRGYVEIVGPAEGQAQSTPPEPAAAQRVGAAKAKA